MRKRLLLLFMLATVSLTALAQSLAELPRDSLYQLRDRFTDQDGRDFHLSDLRGQPVLVTMFYTSCRYVCPLIIDTAKRAEHEVTEAQRANLRVLIVSLDPARDDVAALKAVADRRRLDTSRWTLARTDETGVRRLAALLGVRYRALADGEFNHTSAIVLLDADGRKIAEHAQLGAAPPDDFTAALHAALETENR